jgi:hypothetical protein
MEYAIHSNQMAHRQIKQDQPEANGPQRGQVGPVFLNWDYRSLDWDKVRRMSLQEARRDC